MPNLCLKNSVGLSTHLTLSAIFYFLRGDLAIVFWGLFHFIIILCFVLLFRILPCLLVYNYSYICLLVCFYCYYTCWAATVVGHHFGQHSLPTSASRRHSVDCTSVLHHVYATSIVHKSYTLCSLAQVQWPDILSCEKVYCSFLWFNKKHVNLFVCSYYSCSLNSAFASKGF